MHKMASSPRLDMSDLAMGAREQASVSSRTAAGAGEHGGDDEKMSGANSEAKARAAHVRHVCGTPGTPCWANTARWPVSLGLQKLHSANRPSHPVPKPRLPLQSWQCACAAHAIHATHLLQRHYVYTNCTPNREIGPGAQGGPGAPKGPQRAPRGPPEAPQRPPRAPEARGSPRDGF